MILAHLFLAHPHVGINARDILAGWVQFKCLLKKIECYVGFFKIQMNQSAVELKIIFAGQQWFEFGQLFQCSWGGISFRDQLAGKHLRAGYRWRG